MMGYICHHAILVTSYSHQRLQDAHDKAARLFRNVSPIMPSLANDKGSFFVPPDGSKEAWAISNEGDLNRAEFVGWLKDQAFDDGSSALQWCEVQFGDDNGNTKILHDSDEWKRQKIQGG